MSKVNEELEMYKENIIDHYKHPRNCHELQDFTFQQKELNPLCGDEITLFLKITDNKVQAVSFIGQGCAISQASISLLTDYLKGKTFDEIKKISKETMFELLGIPISHTRMKCALLSLKALSEGLIKMEEKV
jgi:nitrogen fixation protein NifU and related proteins